MPGTPTTLYQLVQGSVAGDNNAWGGNLNTSLTNLDKYLGVPRLPVNAPAVGATTTLDFNVTPSAAFAFTVNQVTTIAFANVPNTLPGAQTGMVWCYCLITNGGSSAVTWPAAVSWLNGNTAPTLQASGFDVVLLVSVNGGTNWYGTRLNSGFPKRHCRATNTTDFITTLASGVEYTFSWDTNDASDIGGLHSTAVQPTRIVIPSGWEGGGILLSGGMVIAAASTSAGAGLVQCYISKNGTGGSAAIAVATYAADGVGDALSINITAYDPAPVAGDYYNLSTYVTGSQVPSMTLYGNTSGRKSPQFSAIQLGA